jgi:hypothetical protein
MPTSQPKCNTPDLASNSFIVGLNEADKKYGVGKFSYGFTIV